MPDPRLVEQILSAIEDGVPAEVVAMTRVVRATAEEVHEALAAVAHYRHRVDAERDERATTADGETDALAAGTQLGDFVVEGVLGRGAMGVVYRARQISLGRPVALKVLPKSLVDRDPRFLARFRREATLAATIHHPHVAEVYGFTEASGAVCFAMRLVEGPTLHEVLQRLAHAHVAPQRPTSPAHVRQVVLLVRALADALAVIHAHGLVHRDVKPANVLIEGHGPDALGAPPVLVDFGLLRPCGATDITLTRTQLGTPAYASPEGALGQDVDARADVFSLGATLYDLLTLTSPGTRGPATAGLPDVRSINPTVDDRLAAIVAMALQPNRALRYEHGGALRDELDRYLGQEAIRALPASALARLRLWTRRDPLAAVRVGTILAGAILVLSTTLWFAVWASGVTGLARTARRLEREGDLLGAAWAWQDLRAEQNAGRLPWLADDLERARSYWEGDGALRRAVDGLWEVTGHRRDGATALAAVEDTDPAAPTPFAMVHHSLCEIMLDPEQRAFSDAARSFLLREVSGDVPELRRRLAMDAWSDYLLVQPSPQVYPAELPSRLSETLLRYPEPSLPTWQAAAAAYGAIRKKEVFADLVAVLDTRNLDAKSTMLCLAASVHLYRWLHLAHRRSSSEPFDAIDRELLQAWARGTGKATRFDPTRVDAVVALLAWWERSPESHGPAREPLTLTTSMRNDVDEKSKYLAAAWHRGREDILRFDINASRTSEYWNYLTASGRAVDPFTSALWTSPRGENLERIAVQDNVAATQSHTPSRLDLGRTSASWRATLSGTLLAASVRGSNRRDSENGDTSPYLEFDRPGHSQLRLRTLVPAGVRGLTIELAQMIGARSLLREGGRAVFRLSILGYPPFEVTSLVFNPALADPAADTLPDHNKFLALVPRQVLAGRSELEIVLDYVLGNTTYRVYGADLIWDAPGK